MSSRTRRPTGFPKPSTTGNSCCAAATRCQSRRLGRGSRSRRRTSRDAACVEAQLVENIQRENAHPLEEAFAVLRPLHTDGLQYDIASLAARPGKVRHSWLRAFGWSSCILLSQRRFWPTKSVSAMHSKSQSCHSRNSNGRLRLYLDCQHDTLRASVVTIARKRTKAVCMSSAISWANTSALPPTGYSRPNLEVPLVSRDRLQQVLFPARPFGSRSTSATRPEKYLLHHKLYTRASHRHSLWQPIELSL